DLKSVTAKESEEQKLVLRLKETDDHKHLQMVGVKGNAKVILIKNLSTVTEDCENGEKVKENVELMETIEENN
ncbi:BAG family molecular chaperone regulator 4-like protein, partial [Tanacetum coccineum]